VKDKWLSGICRDRTPYLVLGVGRIANPTYIWRHTTLIPNEADKSTEKAQNDIAQPVAVKKEIDIYWNHNHRPCDIARGANRYGNTNHPAQHLPGPDTDP
jgi:hypothetical protein